MSDLLSPRKVILPSQWAYLAGWLEAEGYFQSSRRSSIVVSFQDKDTVSRVRLVFGGKLNGPYFHNNPRHKPIWIWAAHGSLAETVIRKTVPYLGVRRTKQALFCGGKSPNYCPEPFAFKSSSVLAYAWLAGYLEGEGSFFYNVGKALRCSANSTDVDVLRTVLRVAGGRLTGPYSPNYVNAKPVWAWHVSGVGAAYIMARVFGSMSSRRRQQILRSLSSWVSRRIKLQRLSSRQVSGIRAELSNLPRTLTDHQLAAKFNTPVYSVQNIKYGYCYKNGKEI